MFVAPNSSMTGRNMNRAISSGPRRRSPSRVHVMPYSVSTPAMRRVNAAAAPAPSISTASTTAYSPPFCT